MVRSKFTASVALAALAALGGSVWAQGSQSTGGTFGSRTLGGGVSSGTRTTFGTAGGDRIEQAQSGAGEVEGSERFIRGNRQAGDFVGSDTRDVSNTIFGSAGGQAGTGLSGLGNLGALQNRAANANRNSSGQNRITYSLGLKVGFDPPESPAAELSSRIEGRLAKLSQIRRFQSWQVRMEGRTAIIRGAVASEHERNLAESLVRLEPGVSQVRNEVTVGQPPADRTEEVSPVVNPSPTAPAPPSAAPSLPAPSS